MKERIHNELSQNGINAAEQDLWISTFHTLGSRILRAHAVEANLSPDFTLASEGELRAVYDDIVRKIQNGEIPSTSGRGLNFLARNELRNSGEGFKEQGGLSQNILDIKNLIKLTKIAPSVDIFEEIYLIIKKIKSLGISPQEFLDKTSRATVEFSNTLKSLPFGFADKTDYFNAWENVLKEYLDDSYSDEDIEKLFDKSPIITKNGKSKAEFWTQKEGCKANIDKIEQLELYFTQVVALVYAIYQSELETLDMVDFDDLINKPVQILKQNGLIRAFYQKSFAHIIIDEFQDTNGAQLELIKLLLHPDKPNLTFVGDRKQSIYGFRHAQPENLDTLHDFAQQKYGQKFEPVQLSTNYRSTGYILNLVNTITKNQLKLDENLYSPEGNPEIGGYKDVFVTTLPNIEDGYHHKITEAEYIAKEILKIKQADDTKFGDFAILVSSHADADFFDTELEKYAIPCVKSINTEFFTRPTAKNIIAMFRLAKNIHDEAAFVRLLQAELSDRQIYMLKTFLDKKLSDFQMENGKWKMENEPSHESLSSLLAKGFHPLPEGEGLYTQMNFSEKITMAYEKSLFLESGLGFEIVDRVTKIMEFFDEPAKKSQDMTPLQVYHKIVNFLKNNAESDILIMEKIVADFVEKHSYNSVSAFIKFIENVKEDRNFEMPVVNLLDVDAVKLMTIHASKGLEFPYVFVASLKNRRRADTGKFIFDLQYGSKPGFGMIIKNFNRQDTAKKDVYNKIWKNIRDDHEKLRLFYVAVTRAQKYLNILSFEKYGSNAPAEYVNSLILEMENGEWKMEN